MIYQSCTTIWFAQISDRKPCCMFILSISSRYFPPRVIVSMNRCPTLIQPLTWACGTEPPRRAPTLVQDSAVIQWNSAWWPAVSASTTWPTLTRLMPRSKYRHPLIACTYPYQGYPTCISPWALDEPLLSVSLDLGLCLFQKNSHSLLPVPLRSHHPKRFK